MSAARRAPLYGDPTLVQCPRVVIRWLLPLSLLLTSLTVAAVSLGALPYTLPGLGLSVAVAVARAARQPL